jgi:hypothetical protein
MGHKPNCPCLSWLVLLAVLHTIVALSTDDGVQPLAEPAPLPKLAVLAPVAELTVEKVAPGSQQALDQLGESNQVSKKFVTPEEERKALESEDHDENIQAMEQEEHLKAFEKAKDTAVPEEVICYHDLVNNAENQQSLAEKMEEQAKSAEEKFKTANHRKEESSVAAAKLKRRMERDLKAKTDSEAAYKKEHTTALNAFAAAKGNLDNYNIERKKVDLDSTRSKQVLEKYLDFKKKFIEASANSDDPSLSKEVGQYKKLSEQYLTSYHGLQTQIKSSYTAARRYSDLYSQLSRRYQKISSDANDIAVEVSRTSADYVKSRKAHKEKQQEYEKHAAEAQKWKQTMDEKKAAAKAASDKYEELDAKAHKSKVNYFKLHSLAHKYQEMGDESKRKVELNQVRMFNFEQDVKKTALEIEASIKSVALFKRKYETADAAGMIYTKSYRDNGCQGTLLKESKHEPAKADSESPNVEGAVSLVQLRVEPANTKYSAEECMSDKNVATQNLEASEKAKLAHQEELTHLHVLKEDHKTSDSGAKTAKAIMVGSEIKASKYLQVAEHAAEQAKNPCAIE